MAADDKKTSNEKQHVLWTRMVPGVEIIGEGDSAELRHFEIEEVSISHGVDGRLIPLGCKRI